MFMFHILYYSNNYFQYFECKNWTNLFEQRNLPDLEMFVNVFFFRTAANKNTLNMQKMMSRPRACWSPSSFKLVLNSVKLW